MEDIRAYLHLQRSTQINPNASTTNIFHLNHPKAVRLPSQALLQTVTPPTSKSPTPVFEKRDMFLLSSLGGSTASLDAFPSFSEDVGAPWFKRAIPNIDFEVLCKCGLWYGFSIVSSNSTKAILLRFEYPVTLTQFQFLLNALLCVALFWMLTAIPKLASRFPRGSVPDVASLNHSVISFLTPTAFIVSTTLPMGLFQIAGHISGHKATSVIPVSLVHTVKALSPITTLAIYRLVFKTSFRRITYVTLVPLIAGIMMTCYKPRRLVSSGDGYVAGLGYAFISMFIFVSQNVYAKKRLTVEPEEKDSQLPSFNRNGGNKLDKLTILLFCSLLGFLLTMPVYVVLELRNDRFSLGQMHWHLAALVVLNGVSHFMQSLLAFLLLGSILPINYLIANIMKRIVVIIVAFVWESLSGFSATQTCGIALTVVGLYCYDRWGINRDR